MEPIRAEEGWFVLHLFYTADRRRWAELANSQRLEVRESFTKVIADFRLGANCQVNCYAILGHKADFGMMMIDPELKHLSETENSVLKAFPPGMLTPAYSFFSLTEISEYMSQDKDYDRTLREKEGLTPDSEQYKTKMQAFRERMRFYINERLYPQIPEHKAICFYPMNKARGSTYNWYSLDFDSRKNLMAGHLVSGRRYQGKLKQLVTGSVGLDAWEWGVTLFADDPFFFKKVVYEMRFDEVSARYGEFGDFLVGVRMEPADLFEHLRL